MALKKEPICRIVIKSPDGKKSFWSGTVYHDVVFKRVEQVVDKVKRVLE